MNEKEKLIQMIKDNEEIQRYVRIEKVINSNPDLKKKFGQLKAIQKELGAEDSKEEILGVAASHSAAWGAICLTVNSRTAFCSIWHCLS